MSDVYFCNLCDQSVPQIEIEEGRARRVGDRTLCHTCRTVLSTAMPKSGGGGGAGWFAIGLALIAGLAAGFVWLESDRADEGLSNEVNTALTSMRGDLQVLRSEISTGIGAAEEDRALLDRRSATLQDSQRENQKALEARISALQSSVDEFGRYFADQESMLRRIDQLEATLSVVEDRLRGHRADLVALRDEVDRHRDLISTTAAAVGPAQDAIAAEFTPEISGLLQQLQDDDQNIRYNALERLQPLQDLRLLPHLYPALSDPYEFNRFLAAHILGDWSAKPAVPHLVETLNDEITFVREAAVNSLRRLTGQNFGFDPRAGAEARKRAYESWRTWWEANGEEFLAGAG